MYVYILSVAYGVPLIKVGTRVHVGGRVYYVASFDPILQPSF